MTKTMTAPSLSKTGGARNRTQALLLIVFGLLCLLCAFFLHYTPSAYPIGLFLFGLGMLIAAFVNPYRLLISGILVTVIGADIFLEFKNLIPYAGDTTVLAIGIGLILVALAARRGYMGVGAMTPGLIVILVGIFLYPPATHFFPRGYVNFVLSLWFPGILLLALGIIYLLVDGLRRRNVQD